jgi:hypothetical protein
MMRRSMLCYRRRRYEFELFGPRLRKQSLERGCAWHISEIYSDANKLKLRWQGIYTITKLHCTDAAQEVREVGFPFRIRPQSHLSRESGHCQKRP